MFNVVKAEMRKLRRPTLFFGTMGAALFFTGLITSFIYLMIDSPRGNGDRGRTIGREVLQLASGSVNGFASVGGFLGIIALCVFAAQTAQEYTYGTLRNLLVRQPGRMKILIGKLISMMLFALIMISIAAIVSVAISYILAPGAKVNTDLWLTSAGYHAIFTTFVNVTVSVTAFGIVGMVLGLLLRSPISAISLGVLWLLIVENLLIAVKSSLQSWLPGAQLDAIASGGTLDLTYKHALTVGGIYVAVGATIASILFVRRDVAN
ncbi:MAG: ABC transporter permease [Actinomycetes bacterium]|jgi:ABC-2 type transport system permease protein